jgi:phospholipid/cholesterol/gamma-HCH transport system ATP-binding protein
MNAIELQDVVVEGEDGETPAELSLAIQRGEWVVLIGPNRSGKSLVLELCTGLRSPDRGTVRVLGRSLASLDEDGLSDLRLHLGVVLQQPGLLTNMTVFNNVALPLRYHTSLSEDEVTARVLPLLEELDLIPVRDRFPAGLSPGEARCAAIARALVTEPDLLLLDEPVLGLDADRARRLADLLDRRRRGRTRTIVTLLSGFSPLVERADRVAFIRNGRVEAFGPRAALTTDAGRHGYLT